MNAALLDLHKVAGGHGDAHLTDFLEENFLGEQASQFFLMRVEIFFEGGEHQRDWGPGDEDEKERRWNRAAYH